MTAQMLTHREIAYLCRNLAELLQAGISPAEGCWLLAQEENSPLQPVLQQLGVLLDEGTPLGEAMQQLQRFPAATAGLITTGECAGKPEEALLAAAGFHETRARTRRLLRNALGYPGMLLGLMLTVVGVLLTQVLPIFDSVYASLGTRLTGIGAGLLHLGQGLKQLLPVLFILLLVPAALAIGCALSPRLRGTLAAAFGALLDDRGIHRKFNNAQFVQALAMGMGSGLLPEEAAVLAASLLKDSPSASARCEKALKQIREGISLPDALLDTLLMPPYACRMLAVGIRGGNPDRILEDVACRMQEEAEQALEDGINALEPAMVLAVSILVGGILLSVMLPLLNILTALG